VIIPVLSTMGIQVCSVPTAVLSTHTGGFTDYHFVDLTEHMEGFIKHWDSLGIGFDAVYSEFLGSPRQVEIVKRFIETFSGEQQFVVVDPIKGNEGKTYGPIGPEMVVQIRRRYRIP